MGGFWGHIGGDGDIDVRHRDVLDAGARAPAEQAAVLGAGGDAFEVEVEDAADSVARVARLDRYCESLAIPPPAGRHRARLDADVAEGDVVDVTRPALLDREARVRVVDLAGRRAPKIRPVLGF